MLSFSTIRSVAIIGASEDPKKIGNILLAKNQNFTGNIYGINPKWGEAYGKPFYKSISELPEVPDIAVFAIPEVFIYSSLEEAGKCGVKKAIIITAGFKEVGNTEGEKKLQEIAKEYNIRILWPNCLGFADTHNGLNLSFGSQFFNRGNIGIISQSGAMAVAITDVLAERGLGFSSLFSLGNKSDIDESDLLRELADDPHTHMIALYLENISRGRFFIETLREVTRQRPVIIMLGGVSERGKQATTSHTGSLSGDRLILEAAIRQGKGILTYSLSEYFNLIDIFSRARDEHIVGSPIIVTNAGGPGVLMTDQCDFQSITLEMLTSEDSIILRENMPSTMSSKNPIDIIGDADSTRVSQILENIIKIRKEADIIFIFTVQATTDIDTIAERIIDFDTHHPEFQPYVCLIGGETVEKAKKMLTKAGIWVTDSTESIAQAYGQLSHYYAKRGIINTKPEMHTNTPTLQLLSPEEANATLKEYSIPTTSAKLCQTLEEALEYTNTQAPPYVMKVSGPHIAHKTDMDGVQWDIKSAEDIKHAYEKIQSGARKYFSTHDTYMVTMEEQISPSPKYEFFFGAKRDANFWDTFVIGTGGIYLSVIADTTVHIGTPTHEELDTLLENLHFAPILSGYRGQVAIDREALISIVLNLTTLFREHTEIQEIDINPILFQNGKPMVVDAKLYI